MLTLLDAAKQNLDWGGATERLNPARFDPNLTIPNLDTRGLSEAVTALTESQPCIPWQSARNSSLYGMGLTYDPSSGKPYLDCFGDPYYLRYSTDEYFDAVEADDKQRVRGGYLDCLRYDTLTPAVYANPRLRQLFESFRLPVVRSSLRIIDGNAVSPSAPSGGYHCDESPFDCLRLNICVDTNDSFGLQYEGRPPMFLSAGDHRIVMTHKRHRAFVVRQSDFQRIHIVISVVPWLKKTQSGNWVPNEYFGEIHPFDMVKEGLLLK